MPPAEEEEEEGEEEATGEELEKSVSGELFERGSGGGGLRRVERDKADAVPKATSSCNPQGRRVEQVWPGRSACASSPARLKDSPGAEGPSAAEAPGCALRDAGVREMLRKGERGGELGVRRTRPWRNTWSGERGKGWGTSLVTAGTLQVGHCRDIGFLAGGGQTDSSPWRFACVLPPHPSGCGTSDRTLPHAAGSCSRRALSRGARTTCFAANRGRRLIQSELLKGAATPPPFPRDTASVALSGWALPVFYRSVLLVWSSAKK